MYKLKHHCECTTGIVELSVWSLTSIQYEAHERRCFSYKTSTAGSELYSIAEEILYCVIVDFSCVSRKQQHCLNPLVFNI